MTRFLAVGSLEAEAMEQPRFRADELAPSDKPALDRCRQGAESDNIEQLPVREALQKDEREKAPRPSFAIQAIPMAAAAASIVWKKIQ